MPNIRKFILGLERSSATSAVISKMGIAQVLRGIEAAMGMWGMDHVAIDCIIARMLTRVMRGSV